MKTIRSITRYIGRWGIHHEPFAEPARVVLQEDMGGYSIVWPYGCTNAVNGLDTTDGQLAAVLGRNHFPDAESALAHARASAPHWGSETNQAVLGRLYDALRWDGSFVGPNALADALDVSRESLCRICRGEVLASRRQAAAAKAYVGRARV